MGRTLVTVHFNGASNFYYFDMPRKEFMVHWESQLDALGYVSAKEMNEGKIIVISPKQCGAIEIEEVNY